MPSPAVVLDTRPALARAAGTSLISIDQHLLATREHLDVPVLTPGAFWQAQLHASERAREEC